MSQKDFDNLGQQGYTGNLNDRQKKFLLDVGYDTLFDWLGSLGYTGTINDRLHQRAVASGWSNLNDYLAYEGAYTLSRYFTRFDSGVNAYGEFTNDVVLDDEFRISVRNSGVTGQFGRLLGNQASFDNQFRVNSDGSGVLVRAAGGTEHTIATDNPISLSSINELSVYRASGSSTINLDVNGVYLTG